MEQFFRGCPDYQRSLAEQAALPYLQLEHRGTILHRVTAAIWDEGKYLVSANDWDMILADGVDLVCAELIADTDEAFAHFQGDYGISSNALDFTRSLFARKVARPAARIELSAREFDWIKSTSQENEALRLAVEKLEALDIFVPGELIK